MMRTRAIVFFACLLPFFLSTDAPGGDDISLTPINGNPPAGTQPGGSNTKPDAAAPAGSNTRPDSAAPADDPQTCHQRPGVDPSCKAVLKKVERGSQTAIAGQMLMMQLNQMLDGPKLKEDYKKLFAFQNVGSVFDAPGPMRDGGYDFNVTDWRNLYTEIQQAFKEMIADPVLFALDSVHGANYVRDAVILPAQINMGASFNTELVRQAGAVAGEETLAAGAPLLFFPILDLAIDKNWARIQETFGESSFVVSELGAAAVEGVQSTKKTSACVKHFAAYSMNRGGFDRSSVDVNAFEFKNKFLTPYKKAIAAGVKCIMESYISINRIPVIESTLMLNYIVRDVLGFKGILISDYREVDNLVDWHKTAETTYEAAELALKTSLDMNMEATSTEYIVNVYKAIQDKTVTMGRLEESYNRIKAVKTELGLYDELIPGAEYLKNFRSAEHVKTALDLARESMVLYKNDNNLLPLKKETKIFLTGPGADDIGLQCGAWTYQWQGIKEANKNFPHGISFEAGLKRLGANVVSSPGLYVNGSKADGYHKVKELAAAADVIVLTLAEEPSTEKPGDTYDLSFNAEQLKYANELAKLGKKIVLVLMINRPRLLQGLADKVDAILNTMLSCEMGGQAFAEIMLGEISPSGKSPYTYPKYQSVSDVTFDLPVDDKCVGYQICETEFDFGSGLSYVNISYGSIHLSSNEIKKDDILTVSVELTNNGGMVAKEAVLLYLIQPVRRMATPEYQTLQGFQKVELHPNVPQTVTFKLNSEAWTVYSPDSFTDFERKFEPTKFYVTFQAFTDCNDGSPDTDCVSFTVS